MSRNLKLINLQWIRILNLTNGIEKKTLIRGHIDRIPSDNVIINLKQMEITIPQESSKNIFFTLKKNSADRRLFTCILCVEPQSFRRSSRELAKLCSKKSLILLPL